MTAPEPIEIEAHAPGKVVLWGEYAVLAGAPAMVMAVNRFASCTLSRVLPAEDGERDRARPSGWRFSSRGFRAEPYSTTRAKLGAATAPPADSPAWTAWHVLQALAPVALPDSADVVIDTTGFYASGAKLGLGSSAAVCVALYGAICELVGRAPDFVEVAGIHHRLQGNKGSGVDIAAAWFGGLLRFERKKLADPLGAPAIGHAALPVGVQVGFVWAGHPAATTAHLQRFADWRARGRTAELDALCDASRALFETTDLIATLREYVACLMALDRAAGLAIFDPAHQELHRLAGSSGVVYKPCGAGGGDIGAAFACDPGAMERFMTSARARGYAPITLETAVHGIQVRR